MKMGGRNVGSKEPQQRRLSGKKSPSARCARFTQRNTALGEI